MCLPRDQFDALARHDVIVARFPGYMAVGEKPRPCLVLSTPAFHAACGRVLVAFVSARVERSFPMEVRLKHWRMAGLLLDGKAQPTFLTVEWDHVGRRLGKLHPHDAQAVDAVWTFR